MVFDPFSLLAAGIPAAGELLQILLNQGAQDEEMSLRRQGLDFAKSAYDKGVGAAKSSRFDPYGNELKYGKGGFRFKMTPRTRKLLVQELQNLIRNEKAAKVAHQQANKAVRRYDRGDRPDMASTVADYTKLAGFERQRSADDIKKSMAGQLARMGGLNAGSRIDSFMKDFDQAGESLAEIMLKAKLTGEDQYWKNLGNYEDILGGSARNWQTQAANLGGGGSNATRIGQGFASSGSALDDFIASLGGSAGNVSNMYSNSATSSDPFDITGFTKALGPVFEQFKPAESTHPKNQARLTPTYRR